MIDLISRQAAIDIVEFECGEWSGLAKTIAEEIKQLPSVHPERKTGKWIERNPQNSPNCRLIECSECGEAYIVGYNIDYDYWIDGRNFCTKCGADMRGEQDG